MANREVSSSLAVIANAPYLYFSNGNAVVEKYVGNLNYLTLVSGRGVGGALAGNYMIVYNNGSVTDKYIGNRSGNEMLVGGPGLVEVREDGAYIVLQNGKISRYNLTFGKFESI